MQVEYIKNVAGDPPEYNGNPGLKRDLPADIAKELIQAGAVVPLNPADERKTAKVARGKTETR